MRSGTFVNKRSGQKLGRLGGHMDGRSVDDNTRQHMTAHLASIIGFGFRMQDV